VAYIHTTGYCIRLIIALGRKRKQQREVVQEVDVEPPAAHELSSPGPEPPYVADSYEVHAIPPPRSELESPSPYPPPYSHPDEESNVVADGIPPMKSESEPVEKGEK
jgi:hypothetical protein